MCHLLLDWSIHLLVLFVIPLFFPICIETIVYIIMCWLSLLLWEGNILFI